MATVQSPVARVPFAPLDNPRLQHLANAKNRQNGLSAQKSTATSLNSKASNSFLITNKSLLSPSSTAGKRSFEPSTFDEYDSENVDPALFDSPSKKSKNETLAKPFNFTVTPQRPMLPPSFIPSRLSTPARVNAPSPRAPLTAPAGRSPRRKIAGIRTNRRVSAPFTRIDPVGTSRGSTLPFSLDAALSGTFSTSSAASIDLPKPEAESRGATIQESMPRTWFFDIYEDTPEEEAANLMEHSTLTLDLSSDEESTRKEKTERGKENTPPEGYDAPTASRSSSSSSQQHDLLPKQVKKTEIVRQKICAADEMDDGSRSPLSDLETEPFIPVGLERGAHVLVDDGDVEEKSKEVVVAPLPAPAPMPVVDGEGELKGEIIVWEDDAAAVKEV